MIIHSNVEGDIEVYKLPVITEKKIAWIAQVTKGGKDFQPP